jgi:hypothetical protein
MAASASEALLNNRALPRNSTSDEIATLAEQATATEACFKNLITGPLHTQTPGANRRRHLPDGMMSIRWDQQVEALAAPIEFVPRFYETVPAGWSAFMVPAPEHAKRPHSRKSSAFVVLVAAAPPVACVIAPLGGAVKPLPHAPESVQSARIGRIRVIDDAVLQNIGTHSRPLAEKGWDVDARPVYVLGGRVTGVGRLPGIFAFVVVLDAAVAELLITAEADAKVGIEFTAE